MKKTIYFSFFVLGLTSIISQLVIIREAIINFYGNELFIGLAIGFWLIWVSIGSLSLPQLFSKPNSLKVLVFCHFITPFVLFGEIILFRLNRLLLANSGQTPDFILSLGYLFLIIAPLCLILGLQFVMAAKTVITNVQKESSRLKRIVEWIREKFFVQQKIKITYLVSQGYFYEALGLVIGGLLFSFIFVRLDSINLFFVLAIINIGILLMLIIFTWLTPDVSSFFINKTNNWRFANQKLVKSVNTRFGQIAITQTGDQYNFYESGLFIGSTQENFFKEELIHFPLLYHSSPKQILLIGGGFNGVINEILKYPVEKIYYLELDPQLITLVQPYLSPELLVAQKDPRVNIVFDDAIHFLKTSDQSFDIVIVNLPNPSTVLINRFYTINFFERIKEKLNQDGILEIYLSSSANYFSPGLEDLATSVFRRLDQTFDNLVVLPEDNILYLASQAKINYNPWQLLKRYNQYGLNNQLVTKDYIYYRLTNERVAQALDNFKADSTPEINADIQPVGYWHQNLFWFSSHYPKITKSLGILSKITLGRLVIFSLIMFFIIFYSLDVLVKKKERILATLTTIPEFSMLSVEIIFLFLFQIIYGYLYYQLSLIITVLLTGIGVSTWLANFLVLRGKVKYSYLIRLYFYISLYFIFLVLIILFLPQALELPAVFYWLVFMAGFLGGMEFPMVNKFYLQLKLEPDKKTGTIYSADSLGSSLGAIIATIFLLPILGIWQTVVFLALVNILAFLGLFFLRQNFEEN